MFLTKSNVAIQQFEKTENGNNEMAVYLSGNGPLVDVLTESLARDKKKQAEEKGEKLNQLANCSFVQARCASSNIATFSTPSNFSPFSLFLTFLTQSPNFWFGRLTFVTIGRLSFALSEVARR